MSLKESAGNAATGTTITSGAMGLTGWVNEHYQILLLGIMIFSTLTALLFYWLNYRLNRKRAEHLENGD